MHSSGQVTGTPYLTYSKENKTKNHNENPHRSSAMFLTICLFRFCLGDLFSALLQVYQESMLQEILRWKRQPCMTSASISSTATDSRSHRYPVPTTELGYLLFSSVLRPPSVWRNSEEVGQWVSELLWPRRGRGMIAQEMTWTGTEGLGRGMKTNVYVFNGLNKSV